jgi:hypothetical protein
MNVQQQGILFRTAILNDVRFLVAIHLPINKVALL